MFVVPFLQINDLQKGKGASNQNTFDETAQNTFDETAPSTSLIAARMRAA